MFIRTIACLFALLFLVGCSTTVKETQLEEASFALKVAKMGGCGANLKDVEPQVMEEAFKSTNKVTGGDIALSSSLGLVKDGLSGLSLNFFRSLTAKSGARSQNNCVIAWMPTDLAENEKVASEKFITLLTEAAEKNMPRDIEYKVVDTTVIALSRHLEPADSSKAGYSTSSNKPTAKKAPSWLNIDDAYEFRNAFIGRHYQSLHKEPLFDEVEYLKAVSEDLPDWAYIYLAPKPWQKPYPIVLHNGEAHYFVKNGS